MDKRLICFLASSILMVGAATAQTVDCAHATLMKWAGEHGFRVQTSDGNELYCRTTIIVGSRIPHNECGTEAELASYAFNQIVDNNLVQWTCGDYRP
jgi:hypothetical protein